MFLHWFAVAMASIGTRMFLIRKAFALEFGGVALAGLFIFSGPLGGAQVGESDAGRRQLGAIIRGGLPEDSSKRAIELSQGLEPDIVGHLADPQVGIEQPRFCVLQPDARDVIGELQPGGLPEHLAEVENAGTGGMGDVGQRKALLLVRAINWRARVTMCGSAFACSVTI